MHIIKGKRGFEFLMHGTTLAPLEEQRLASQSSAIGDHEDSADHPGTSFLWIGNNHHLGREDVAQLVRHLQAWLETGSLAITEETRDT
jgi:hypothetical protein